ncbi:MAG: hypothetical protein AABW46_02145 [Nanoarchaeota archaeon]
MYKKAQVNTIDLIIAVSLFFVLILSFILIWDNYAKKLDEKVKYDNIAEKAIKITDVLVNTHGIPDDWETDSENVQIIGLTSNARIVSDNKLEEFVNLDYNFIKQNFNIEAFDFYLKVVDSNNKIIQIDDDNVEIGIKPSLDSEDVITIQRIIARGGTEVVLEFTLWK